MNTTLSSMDSYVDVGLAKDGVLHRLFSSPKNSISARLRWSAETGEMMLTSFNADGELGEVLGTFEPEDLQLFAWDVSRIVIKTSAKTYSMNIQTIVPQQGGGTKIGGVLTMAGIAESDIHGAKSGLNELCEVLAAKGVKVKQARLGRAIAITVIVMFALTILFLGYFIWLGQKQGLNN